MRRLLPLLLAGCVGTPGNDDQDSDTDADTDTGASDGFTTCAGLVARTTCPDDARTFDAADARNVLAIQLDWSWSSACFQSVAEPIYLRVPDDAVSLTLTVDAGLEGTAFDLVRDGEQVPVLDTTSNGQSYPAFTATFPSTPDDPGVAGCWAVFPRMKGTEPDTTPGQLDVFVRRGDATSGTLKIVGVIVDEAPLTAQDVADVLGVAVEDYSAGGLTVELAPVETLSFRPGEPLGVTGGRQDLLRTWTDPQGTGAVPVFFIPSFAAGGTIGIAGGIPGAPRAGTATSGVTVAVEPLVNLGSGLPDLAQMGQTVTHELGHQLGLFHTSEATGLAHDPLDDTPECLAERDTNGTQTVESDECEGFGADHVMFWQSRGHDQRVLSPDQRAMVLRGGAVEP